jgi:hypothetical protein
MYFQLYPSTLHTEETEFGLLPTPRTLMPLDAEQTIVIGNRSIRENGKEFGVNLETLAFRGLLPTPTTQEPTPECEINENGRRVTTNGKDSHSLNIGRMAAMGMLPTPCATEAEKAGKGDSQNSLTRMVLRGEMLPTPRTSDERMHWKTENWKGDDLGSHINEMLGTRSHLSPQFVLEMMGFPTDWTLLPFLSGETNPSKQEETQ